MPPRQAALRECASCLGQWLPCQLCLWQFLPVAFFRRYRQIYKQFGLTIAHRDLYVSRPHPRPSLSALLLRRNQRDNGRGVFGFFGRDQLVLIGLMGFDSAPGYARSLSFLVRIRDRACRLCGAGGDGLALYRRTYRISPNEDQGYFISIIQAPEASLNYTNDIMRRWKQNY